LVNPLKVLGVLFLGEVSPAFLPSKQAYWTHKFRHLGVGQQYPLVSFADLPKIQMLALLKSQKREVFEAQLNLFGLAGAFKQESTVLNKPFCRKDLFVGMCERSENAR
jgi:hypothetical protein